MFFFPYTSAQFLNDSVFVDYGGMTGTSVQAQRNAAYAMAERKMSEYLETYLLPTTITGTYSFGLYDRWIKLDNTFVERVDLVRLFDETENNYHSISGTAEKRWEVNGYIYEYGSFGMTVSARNEKKPSGYYGSYFQIWERSDSTYKLKYIIWNLDHYPN